MIWFCSSFPVLGGALRPESDASTGRILSGRKAAPAQAAASANQRGFTMLETLLSLALLAGLMTAMSQFVFSVTESWTKSQERLAFTRHTRAVANHLDQLVRTAASTSRASNVKEGAVAVREMRLPREGSAELLCIDLPATDRLFVGAPPEVQVALIWRREEGLLLCWKSRLEPDFVDGRAHEVHLSSFVTAMAYEYRDQETGRWSAEAAPKKDAKGRFLAPSRLRLQFERGGQKTVEWINLPDTREGVPAY